MTKLLASVASLEEAELAAELGADLVDLKDPARGALGAWPHGAVRAAVRRLAGRVPVSATVGDLPMRPAVLREAAEAMAATGADYVKVGFFEGDWSACVAALAGVSRLVAVLMADQRPRLDLLPAFAEAGFRGVMLDTADKTGGGLRAYQDMDTLAGFVAQAQSAGLLAGLAGSLRVVDIAPLAALGPDYLGFRGALCAGTRTGRLDEAAFRRVRRALPPSPLRHPGAAA